MGVSKITRNNQVTLPKDVREIKGLKEGDSILFLVDGEKINIVKMDKDIIKETAGIWDKTKETGVDYERKMRANWQKRFKRETQ